MDVGVPPPPPPPSRPRLDARQSKEEGCMVGGCKTEATRSPRRGAVQQRQSAGREGRRSAVHTGVGTGVGGVHHDDATLLSSLSTSRLDEWMLATWVNAGVSCRVYDDDVEDMVVLWGSGQVKGGCLAGVRRAKQASHASKEMKECRFLPRPRSKANRWTLQAVGDPKEASFALEANDAGDLWLCCGGQSEKST